MTNGERAEVVVLPELFFMRSTHMHGPIWLKQGEEYFPEEKWDDFVVVVLGWWIKTVLSLMDGTNECPVLDFMDGSFHVSMNINEGIWKLECVARFTNREEIRHIFQTKPIELLQNLVTVASQSIQRCKEMNWTSTDLTRLIDLRDSAKKRLEN